jgi:hypothetical protein
MSTTNDLTTAVSAWITQATLQLNHEQLEALHACLQAPDADAFVIIRLKEGSIILQGACASAGKCVELYREDVEPLRPADAFGHHDEGTIQ